MQRPILRNRWLWPLVAAAVVTAAALSLNAQADRQAGAADFTEERLLAHLQILASDEFEGRGAGQPGHDLSANYVASQFQSLGLRPLGDNGTYLQEFVLTGRNHQHGDPTAVTLNVNGNGRTLRAGTDFLPLGRGRIAEVSGDVVFVGEGIVAEGRNDYNRVAPRGRVALAVTGASERRAEEASLLRKARTARRLGATALLIVAADGNGLEATRGDYYLGNLEIPAVVLTASAAAPLMEAASRLVRQENRAGALEDVSASFEITAPEGPVMVHNAIGLLEGSHPTLKDEYIVVGGHLDHTGARWVGSGNNRRFVINYGADDNGSGTTGVLELARYFTERRDQIARSIIFMGFGAEETGLRGSRHFVQNPTVPRERIVAAFNFDMIGRLGDERLQVIGHESSPQITAALQAATQRNPSLQWRDDDPNRVFGRSDHANFYRADIPIAFFFTGLHTQYHQPEDTWDLIDTAGMVRILNLGADIVTQIANLPQRPEFRSRGGQ